MKMKFGALVVAGSGKIGGHVASRNRAGAYLRTKVTPVNPQSVAQQGVRNRLGTLSGDWAGLTQAQRDAWNGAVGEFAKTDVFGDLKNPSGFNLYQRLNNNLQKVGAASIVLPPSVDGVAQETIVSLTATVTGDVLSLVLTDGIPAGVAAYVSATAPVSAGKSFVKSEYRNIATLAAAATTPFDLFTAYTDKFGGLTAGKKVFVKIEFVSITTGLVTVPQTIAAVIGA